MDSAIYQPPNWLDPLDWKAVFGQAGSIEVDLGCGKGSFLLWAAQARPDAAFLGVDRLLKRLRKVDRKTQRLELSNVRLLRIEASYCVSKLVPDNSIAVYHIQFPDPWPKRRHHRRRLFNPAFVVDLYRTMTDGGIINVATDWEDYFHWIKCLMLESGRFDELDPEKLPEEARTDFEREFVSEGREIHRSRWRRGGGAENDE